MRRDPVLTWVALGAVMVASALTVALVAGIDRGRQPDDRSRGSPIRVNAGLSPRTQLFGDTLTARIQVAADTRRVEPGSVQVDGSFGVYSVVAPPALERLAGEATEYVVWTARLRCLKAACLAGKAGRRMIFPPARVTYSLGAGNRAATRSVSVNWPALTVYSRVDQLEVAAIDPRDEPPWRADLASLPKVSYRTPPRLLAGLLFGVSGILIIGAIALLASPAGREAREATAMAERAGARPLPLEQALSLLVADFSADYAVEPRRQALELVAAELGRRGEQDLELSARRLAWSEEPPADKDSRAIAQRIRRLIEEDSNGDR